MTNLIATQQPSTFKNRVKRVGSHDLNPLSRARNTEAEEGWQ